MPMQFASHSWWCEQVRTQLMSTIYKDYTYYKMVTCTLHLLRRRSELPRVFPPGGTCPPGTKVWRQPPWRNSSDRRDPSSQAPWKPCWWLNMGYPPVASNMAGKSSTKFTSSWDNYHRSSLDGGIVHCRENCVFIIRWGHVLLTKVEGYPRLTMIPEIKIDESKPDRLPYYYRGHECKLAPNQLRFSEIVPVPIRYWGLAGKSSKPFWDFHVEL